ncbi:hypothetical protein K1719_035071 [Acacia pycnantha]|nr:hypothetical protein K1719_035071 [Acacia pycnantha]
MLEILPEKVGYNIAVCDFIFGPTLFINHLVLLCLGYKNNGFLRIWTPWLSTELIIGCNMKRRIQRLRQPRKRRKRSLDKSKDLMANKVRNHFLDILRTLKPELLQDDHKIPKDVTWAKVHVQPDTHSCGVHVLTWLQMWDGSSKERMGTQCHSTQTKNFMN